MFPPPPPRLLISDKSLSVAHYFMRYSHPFVLYQAHVCGVLDIQKRTEKNLFFASEQLLDYNHQKVLSHLKTRRLHKTIKGPTLDFHRL